MREQERTDAQWLALAPHLPPQRARTGRPGTDHRTAGEGMLWRLRTGAPWRDLPERYGPWQRVYTRWRRWQEAGVWERARRAAGRGRPARRGGLEPALPRRHQHPRSSSCRGGQKGGDDRALGRSRGGWGTTLYVRTERGGKLVTWTLTAGQRNEATQVTALLERGAVVRPGGGRPRLRPDRVAGDTGRPVRWDLRRRGIRAVIPRLRTESRRGVRFDRSSYRERNQVERTINRLKQHRAIATRDEKLKKLFHALRTLAVILLWLPFDDTP